MSDVQTRLVYDSNILLFFFYHCYFTFCILYITNLITEVSDIIFISHVSGTII